MIQIQSLSHRYPKAETAALDNVSFDIADGECLGLLGHNGAGKTTLMSLLACLLYTSPSPRDVEESRMPSSA